MINKYKAAVVQAAPIFMNLDACIDKAGDLIAQAAGQGASIVAFSECWFPGYPWWVWLSAPANNIKYFQQYHENSLVRGSAAFLRLQAFAEQHNIFISLGASERDHGSLYIAQFLISNGGELLEARRKLKTTHAERMIFGEGNGSDLNVIETTLGLIGQLCCWEHMQPLSKFALYSMHEQLHIAAWPSFSCYPEAYSLGPDLNRALSQVYAAEGGCFVLAPCALVSEEILEFLVESPEHERLLGLGGGYAQIYAPDGSPMCEPLAPDEEGLLFATIDLGLITIAKSFADPVGHYARPDVTRLLLNRSAPTVRQDIDFSGFEAGSIVESSSLAESNIDGEGQV